MFDPEVPEQPTRRRFSAGYNLRVVEEADAATEPGQDAGELEAETRRQVARTAPDLFEGFGVGPPRLRCSSRPRARSPTG
jgi:hypothetical protein